MKTISPIDLKPTLTAGPEIAFLDIREHGQYGEGHPFFSVSLPFSILEARAPILLPRKDTPVILMDDGDGIAEKAGIVFDKLGYTNVTKLDGGAPAWGAAGFTLFKGVNLPSKTFGELVEHSTGTPSISAEELKQLIDENAPVVLLDGRSPGEFKKMTIPTAASCPNAELAYRAPQLMADPDAIVVINCAGRTRSLIGAESLRQCGLPNRTVALRNGTQGWRLAGFDLSHGIEPAPLPELNGEQKKASREKAGELIERWQLDVINTDVLAEWQIDNSRSLYLLDVRTAEEFSQGHYPGAKNAPGGQLVQATDEQVAVRGARIVLCDDTGLRAATTALWLRGMGHSVSILDVNSELQSATDSGLEIESKAVNGSIETAEAASRVNNGAQLLDASSGMDYRSAHIENALWATRARIDQMALSKSTDVIVTGRNAVLIDGVLNELQRLGHSDVRSFPGNPDIWLKAGFHLVETPDSPSNDECIDYLFFVHDRHDGNLEAAKQYLAWETGLLGQLDEQERGVLTPPEHRTT